MIDKDGYRLNVGIVICNQNGQLFWARRSGKNSWQFPQGGIDCNETAEEAMYRELYEEIGLKSNEVTILDIHEDWLSYNIPKRMIRLDTIPICIGQKQKWFLLQMKNELSEKKVNLSVTDKPEFDDWIWVNMWFPIRQVVSFKREVYRKMLTYFSPKILLLQKSINLN